MWWIVIVVIVLFALGYILFAPFFIEVNTCTGLLRLRFHRLAAAGLVFNDSSIFLQLKIIGWQKQIDLLATKKRKKKIVVKDEKKKQRKIPLKKILAVIKSFRIRKLLLTIDTGNMQLNAILYPLFVWLNVCSGKDITINFLDENKLIVQIENNFARMTWAFIKS